MGEDRVHRWISSSQGPMWVHCGFSTLLKGTKAVLWHLPLLPKYLPCFVHIGPRTENPPLLSPLLSRLSFYRHWIYDLNILAIISLIKEQNAKKEIGENYIYLFFVWHRHGKAWIGLHAPDPNTGYVWSDGSPVSRPFFAPSGSALWFASLYWHLCFVLAAQRWISCTGRKESQTITIMMNPVLNSGCITHGRSLGLGMISTVRATTIGCVKSEQVNMEWNAFNIFSLF